MNTEVKTPSMIKSKKILKIIDEERRIKREEEKKTVLINVKINVVRKLKF